MRSPNDSEYAAIGRRLLQVVPDIIKKDNPDELMGIEAFGQSIRLLRTLMGDSKLDDLQAKPDPALNETEEDT